MYPQTGLPYPIDSYTSAFYNVQTGQLPFNINIPVHPSLMPHIPLIVLASIDMIQRDCHLNPLRMFLFNQISVNGFNNPQFIELVKAVAIYSEILLVKSGQRDVSKAIQDSVALMVGLARAENINNYPALTNCIDQNLLAQARQAIMQSANVSAEISQYLQQKNQPAYPQQVPSYPQQQPVGNFYNQQMQPSQPSNSALFNTGQISSHGSFRSNGAFLIKNDPQVQPQPIQQQPIQQQPVQNLNKEVKGVFQNIPKQEPSQQVNPAEVDAVWVASEYSPFTCAYNCFVDELLYVIEPNGAMKPYTAKLPKEKLMEREKHFKPKISGNFIQTDLVSANERTTKFYNGVKNGYGVSSMEKDIQAIEEIAGEALKIDLIDNDGKQCIGISDNEIWKTTELALFVNKESNDKITAYGSYAYVNDVLITTTDAKILTGKVLACDDFLTASNVLLNAIARIKEGLLPPSEMTCVNFLNDRLTKRLNRFMTSQLALACDIDSFIHDSYELFIYIRDTYGDRFLNLLRAYQKEIITSACAFAEDGYEQNIKSIYELNTDDKPYVTLYFTLDYFMSVDVFSADLQFDIPDVKHSVAVFENKTPILYALANYIFKLSEEDNTLFDRCLIRTLDRKVFSFNRSSIDKSTYLVSRY